MKEYIDSYLSIIFLEKNWSWALVAIIALVASVVIRGWFLRPLVRRAKALDKKYYSNFKSAYFRQAIWGWLLLFISTSLVALAWYQTESLPLTFQQKFMLAGSGVCYILSIIFHLIAFNIASLETLQKASSDQLLV